VRSGSAGNMIWEKHGKVLVLKSRGGWYRAVIIKQSGVTHGIGIIGGMRTPGFPSGPIDPFMEITDQGRGAVSRVKQSLENLVLDAHL
jgi:hypothetical protein